MMLKFVLVLSVVGVVVCHSPIGPSKWPPIGERQGQGNESHFANLRSITKDGTNAEAYWSFDGKRFSFQATRDGFKCDQIFTINADGSDMQLVSTGHGRDTCSYFSPDGDWVYYSSTQAHDHYGCPPVTDQSYGYVWDVYPYMDIYRKNLKTGELIQMTSNQGYNAESTISADGKSLIFTSSRDGDLELYRMNLDGSNVTRLTYTPGYDGGAWYSHNNSMIVWRANRPHAENLTEYLELLNLGVVYPLHMQIYIAQADGSNPIQLTNFPQATSFAPVFLPDDSGVVFSSNLDNPAEFHLYMIKNDGTGFTRLTYEGTFNAFPMFSPDGKTLAFESDRNATSPGDINIILADWIQNA